MAAAPVESCQSVVAAVVLSGRSIKSFSVPNEVPEPAGRTPEANQNGFSKATFAFCGLTSYAHGMVVVDRRPWTAPRVTHGPEALDDYLGSTLTYSQVPPRANAAAKGVTVLTNVNASEFRKELAFRFRKNAMRYFTKY